MVMCITPMFIMLATPFTSTSAALACTSAKPKKGDYERTAENIAGIKALIASNKAPAVDLLIPCCSEPLEVVQDTTLAALHQTYPHDAYTVYVLDDGGNDALRDWTEKLAAEMKQSSGGLRRLVYVRREKTKGVPHHYKAGNM